MGQLTLVVEFKIEPGRLDDFKAASRAYIDRTNSETGTLRYDWHISEDGLRCLNVELFEDAAAFLIHHRHVADLGPTMAGVATMDRFSVIGDVTDEVRAQLEGTATGYFSHMSGIDR